MFSLATRYFATTAKELHIIKGYLLPKPPTRPLAPFSCYLSQLSKEGKKPNLTNEVVNWKLLTDEQKKPFIEKSRSMKEKYEQSYNEYKEAFRPRDSMCMLNSSSLNLKVRPRVVHPTRR